MRSKETNRKSGKTILAMILDAYQEYCNLGYPKDPAVYVIKAHPLTLEKIANHLNLGVMSKKELTTNWGFQTQPDNRLAQYEVVFGPEQITIKWDGK